MINKSIKVFTKAVALLVMFGFLCIFGASVVNPFEAYAATENSKQLYYHFDNGTLTISNFRPEDSEKMISRSDLNGISQSITKVVFGGEGDEIINNRSINNPDIPTFSSFANLESADLQHYQGYVVVDMFRNCSKLTDIIFSDNITYICDRAFQGCGISEITLPKGLKFLRESAFEGCAQLKSVAFQDPIGQRVVLDDYVFRDCISLENINLEKAIGNSKGGFSGCSSLREVTVDDSVHDVSLFQNCTSLEKVYFDGIPSIYSLEFANCSSLKEISFPEGFWKLDPDSFTGCSSLEKVTLPRSFKMSKVGTDINSAFSGCNKLTIYGYSNSDAETYANKWNIPFISLDNEANGSSNGNSSSSGSDNSSSGGGNSVGGLISEKKTTASATPTFSKNWVVDAAGVWRIKDKAGSYVTSAWLCDDAVATNGQNVWYLMNTDGTMLAAGLVQDNTGNFYSLEMNHNGFYGMLRYINGTYDGIYIEFSQKHDGTFGAITNQSAIDALKAKYGITKFGIGNDRCVYTKSFE